MARRVSVIVDAEDYFALMQDAMLRARQRILLISWDFDTRIHLIRGRRWWQKGRARQYPSRLGSFMVWLKRHRKDLDIRILTWGFGFLIFLTRGAMVFDLIRWGINRRIDFKLDSVHPIGCSHHQKIAVIDDALAVCGGIDMTHARWDTRLHEPADPRRSGPDGKLHGPWHDLTMMMEGPVACELGVLGRDRWRRAGGKPLEPARPAEHDVWPEALVPQFENVEVGIARTRAEYNGSPGVHEIEELFLQHIARAKRFLYIENQYFASRMISEALAARLQEEDPPEIVVVHPLSANGWAEAHAMDPARDGLVRVLQELDSHGRFHIYIARSGNETIYVHAKLLIVDDEILRVGSANFNNRSMRLDSECDVFIDCARPANEGVQENIRALRYSLLAEHCGLSEDEVGPLLEEAGGSMAEMIARLGGGRRLRLEPFVPRKLDEIERQIVDNELLDPEDPSMMFHPAKRGRGLFRPGSLLGRAKRKLDALDRRRRKR
ncbi:phospholipase D [Altererythrobacter sp. B11]|uniref:phospholipase D-like domain-containing protein n=1 Tax=Altererythrobacter sp. B11 TaxID=2060312 RepID=UPI000DC6FD11|nr:phospholipase D-like domain-containing protein [Altererythrobacter sp. B11]BBC72867.1 phospholipase D [Altererythrobacter sp. B11]